MDGNTLLFVQAKNSFERGFFCQGFQAEDVQLGSRVKTFESPCKAKAFAMTTISILCCRQIWFDFSCFPVSSSFSYFPVSKLEDQGAEREAAHSTQMGYREL